MSTDSIHGQRDPITPAMTENDPLGHGAHHDRSCVCWQVREHCGCYLWDQDCPDFSPPTEPGEEAGR